MISKFDEVPNGRSFNLQQATASRKYFSSGEASEAVVGAYAENYIPNIITSPVGLLYRQGIEMYEGGHRYYNLTANYGRQKKENGNYSFGFDTTGATVNIKTAFAHYASYFADPGTPSGTSANPHHGSIGVKADQTVEGTTIVIPACRMIYTFRHPRGFVNELQATTLARVTGMTNQFPFRKFRAGELLFAGATGNDGSDQDAELVYNLIASEHATITIGNILNVVKPGHAYLWSEFEDYKVSGEVVVRPKAVHVEIVYRQFDFAAFFGLS
jgi:hypothetical protein